MDKKIGNELPIGTIIYYFNDSLKATYRVKLDRPHNTGFRLFYIFDPKDGLWASENLRKIWECNPERHPQCSLFGMLYKKLEI